MYLCCLLKFQLPIPPSTKIALETDFDIVSAEDCSPDSLGSENDILEKLEKDLIDQMKVKYSLIIINRRPRWFSIVI